MNRSLLLLALWSAPGIAAAQSGNTAKMLAEWQRNRMNVLAYIDAMPDSAMGFRPTPGVRSFAEQFDHIVSTNYEVTAAALKRLPQPPALADSAKFLHDKTALRAYAAATYDYLTSALAAATSADLERSVSVYRLPAQPASRWIELSLEHSVWTLGQVVPYLRLNHVTPPAYSIPF